MKSDLIVVGGGPAGLATSIYAALSGMRVTLVERGPLPRDKACGEGLMPAGARLLEEMGVRLKSCYPIDGVRYIDGPTVAEGRFDSRSGLGIRRLELSRALVERARELGVRVLERTRAVEIRDEAGGARVDIGSVTLGAAFVAVADGLHSRLGWRAGLDGRTRGFLPQRYGYRRHFRARPWSRFVEVYWAQGAEAYVTPVSEDEVGVALLWHERASSFDSMLSRFPALDARLRGAPPTSSARGAGPFRRKTRCVQKGRVALVGDAAGYLDPLTGEGIALGFRSARALVEALSSSAGLPSYERAYRRINRPYLWITEMVLLLSRHPRLRRHVVRRLERHPAIFGRLLEVLAEGGSRTMRRGRHAGGHYESTAGLDDRDRARGLVAGGGK